MLAYINKASDWSYVGFEEVNSIEDILKIYERVVIEPNFFKFFKEIPIERLNGFSIEDREKLTKAEIQIIIYDDYIE